MTNLLVENKENDIVGVITSSRENIKSAIEIEKSLKACKVGMLRRVLESIEERLDSRFKEEDKLEHYSYKSDNYKLVNTYYNNKKSTYPGLSYFIRSLDKENVDLLLRFEVDSHLFLGFCTPNKNKSDGKQLDKSEIKDLLCIDELHDSGWWIYWEYLPNNNKSLSPNFKDFNESYFDLFDEDKFNKFIDLCEVNISNMLDKLKKD